jgi:hypothetical protein
VENATLGSPFRASSTSISKGDVRFEAKIERVLMLLRDLQRTERLRSAITCQWPAPVCSTPVKNGSSLPSSCCRAHLPEIGSQTSRPLRLTCSSPLPLCWLVEGVRNRAEISSSVDIRCGRSFSLSIFMLARTYIRGVSSLVCPFVFILDFMFTLLDLVRNRVETAGLISTTTLQLLASL